MATAQRTLRALARQQFGLVSALNARDLGITQKAIQSLLSRGVLSKDIRGVYRFTDEPLAEGHELAADVLWTQRHTAALSHETALAFRGLGELSLDGTHYITVPKRERIRIQPLTNLELVYEDLPVTAIERERNLPVVNVREALRQVIGAGRFDAEVAGALVAEARAKNFITDADAERLTA